MPGFAEQLKQNITLEAPGDFLSGLLAVSELRVLHLPCGSVRELSAAHGVWRVLSPLSGGLRLAAGERGFSLESGQAVVVRGEDELSLLPNGDCELCLLTLCGVAADRIFDAEDGLFFDRGGAAVRRLVNVLSARHKAVPAKEASARAYELLMALCGTGTAGPAGRSTLPPVVEAALGIMRRDYAYLDGISELAERLEVSQEYLTRCFCKYTGVTPGKYLNRVRIENAKLLLRQGRHTVQFVSDACGFSNANYFARVFRESVGLNPREYARAQETSVESVGAEEALYVL